MEIINETNSWISEKKNKINKHLARFIKKKRKRDQIKYETKEKKLQPIPQTHTHTHTHTHTQKEERKKKRGYHEHLYQCIGQVKEMNKFLETQNFSRLN